MDRITVRRRTGALVAAITTGVGVLTACSADDASVGGGPRTLTLGVSGEAQSFDPALQQSAGDQRWRWHAMFDTLLHCEEDGTVVPGAAESYELSADATRLTMRLRDGMTFSDGSPVDAAAAKASIEHMRDSGGSDAGRVEGTEIETPDDLTVVVHAPQPTGQLPTFMCFAPGAIAHPDQLASGAVASSPVSSGPYELDPAGTTTGSVYRFEKREDYWDADRYAYDVVELITMPEATARLNALMSGEIDGSIIQQEQVPEAESAGLHVLSNSAAWAGLYLNDRAGEVIPALGDVRVRRAINMVFDRQAIAGHMLRGEAVPTTQIFNPAATAYVPELDERYPFDVEAARELMAEAGHADGFEVEVPSETGGSAVYNPLIAQQLALLNIEVTEVPLTGPTALSDILGGRFPIFYARIGTGDSLFDIVQSLEPGSIWNVMETEDPGLQPLLDRAQVATGAEARQVYQQINEYIVDQAWFAPWVADNSFFAVTTAEILPDMSDQFRVSPYLRDFAQEAQG
jgi:peptide/nickel transport system substrate-binding protein